MKENIFTSDIFTKELDNFINSTIDSSEGMSILILKD